MAIHARGDRTLICPLFLREQVNEAIALVPRHFEFDGYRRRSFSRAFVVVKRHTIVA